MPRFRWQCYFSCFPAPLTFVTNAGYNTLTFSSKHRTSSQNRLLPYSSVFINYMSDLRPLLSAYNRVTYPPDHKNSCHTKIWKIRSVAAFPFLDLPAELRIKIYGYLLSTEYNKVEVTYHRRGLRVGASVIENCYSVPRVSATSATPC